LLKGPETKTLSIATSDDMEELGALISGRLSIGDVVCLDGPLGAGKTTLARGLIRAWTQTAEEAPSPTFSLVQTYEGTRGALWHCDFYRLNRADEAIELGLEEAFEGAVTVIEWPERITEFLPLRRLEIEIAFTQDGRRVWVTPHGGQEQILS
jgi:tRNA threonylcarbamoyladenosine biosynthesis protein TsaE